MAIGTAAAIGLGLGAVGSVVGASSANKAAGKAADTSLAVAEKNNALAREIYGQNQSALSPFMNRGNVAGDYINAFLGLPSAQTATPTPAATVTPTSTSALASQNTGIVGAAVNSGFLGPIDPRMASAFPNAYNSKILYGTYPDGTVVSPTGARPGTATPTPTPAAAAPTGVTQAQAQNAFGNYIANSDYGFQFGTGSNALNSGYAGAGSLQSGAAMKALEDYRQNLQSGYRNEYLGYLGNQQSTGLGAASALAGVGQNYAGMVSSNNTAAGNAAANAALIKGQNNPWSTGLGFLSGSILG